MEKNDSPAPLKVRKYPKRFVIGVDLGEDLNGRVRVMAEANGMSLGQAAKWLIRKGLLTSKNDRFIAVEIPEKILLSE